MQLTDAVDTEEQQALRAAVRDLLRQHPDASSWKRLTAEMGLAGLAAPATAGGVGATLAEVAVVVEEAGRALAPVPYLPTALAAALVPPPGALLPGLLDGSASAAVVVGGDVTLAGGRLSGSARSVPDGAGAGVLLVAVGGATVAVAGADTAITPVESMDQSRPLADLAWTDAPCEPLDTTPDRLTELVQVLLAAESAAAADRALELTVAYLKTRVQFGTVIGSFQALKHRCADLAVEVASARATARAAVQAAALDDPELPVLAPLAKRHCADVFLHVAGEMIQLHGGIGFTWEHPAHRYFKRAKANQLQFGTSTELRRLVAERAGLL